MKIALAQDAYILYNGHSNFGMGFCFEKGLLTVTQFVNVATPLQSINWRYMRNKQGHPLFVINLSEYGDDLTTKMPYDPWGIVVIVRGAHQPLKIQIFTSKKPNPNARHFTLHRLGSGQRRWDTDYHYKDGKSYFLIYKAGSADMPKQCWRKLLLNSCYSGPYYYPVFNHGTLFYTTDSARCDDSDKTNLIFIRSVINGRRNERIYKDLNHVVKVRGLYDYKAFNK